MPTTHKPFGRRPGLLDEPMPTPRRPLREIPENDPRQSVRRRVLQSGKLCFGQDLALTVDCVINELSPRGMRVKIEPGATIPETVVVVHLRERKAYKAKVAWQRYGSLGLRLISRHDLINENDEYDFAILRRYCVEHQLRASRAAVP